MRFIAEKLAWFISGGIWVARPEPRENNRWGRHSCLPQEIWWLRKIRQTGMSAPPVFVLLPKPEPCQKIDQIPNQGMNGYRFAHNPSPEWLLAVVQWSLLYYHHWGALKNHPQHAMMEV